MKKKPLGKAVSVILFCALSLVAGGINGFVGTGGGIVLVLVLTAIAGVEQKDAFATSLCITVPVSLIALFNYIRNENVDFELSSKLWLPVLLGGLLGAFLVEKLRLKWLSGIFAILVIYSGTCLISR